MSIQNPGQFATQLGKQGSEPVACPRYQPQPPASASAPGSARNTPDPTRYRPAFPPYDPPPCAPAARPDDERLARAAHAERLRRSADMLKFAKREGDVGAADRQARALLEEVKALKDANGRLAEDNRELRDLCCFLDDDRQKGRKLAREWQRFGRYTASVMRQEVSAYQSKLRELEHKQQELLRDNLELKELCLYLDEERGACAACGRSARDDGDGSSSGTNADEAAPAPRALLAERTVQYVRDLELKVKRLEEAAAAAGGAAEAARPEAVVRALQVLEVRERLERERRGGELRAGEHALVREMCNVVWGKLEDAPPAPDAAAPPPPR